MWRVVKCCGVVGILIYFGSFNERVAGAGTAVPYGIEVPTVLTLTLLPHARVYLQILFYSEFKLVPPEAYALLLFINVVRAYEG